MKKCSYCLKMVDDYAAFCSWCGRPFPKETIIGLDSEEEQELAKNESNIVTPPPIMPPPFENLVEGEMGEEEMPPPIPDDWEEECDEENDDELPPPLPDDIFDEGNDGVALPPPYFGEENKKIVPPPYMGD